MEKSKLSLSHTKKGEIIVAMISKNRQDLEQENKRRKIAIFGFVLVISSIVLGLVTLAFLLLGG